MKNEFWFMEITVRISGAQGEGVESAGRLVATIFSQLGYHVYAYRQYASIIKGNPTMFYQIRASDRKIYSHGRWRTIDILVALNRNALAAYRDKASYAVFDSSDGGSPQRKGDVPVPLSEYAVKAGDKIMKNVVAVGALLGLLGVSSRVLSDALAREFGEKGDKIVERNIEAAQLGYDHAVKAAGSILSMEKVAPAKVLLSGAEALAIGAVLSGMRFYAAYPMTPASPIMHFLAEIGPRFGVAVVQAEDEIAAMNMVIGASFAGVRAATGTSGGGFDLMHEAFGLAAMIETPAVVFLSQRGGPSTGLPTETEQGDLSSALSPSHGEYPHIVIAPYTIEDGLYAVAKAFNLSEKFQTPAIVLTDLYFNESLTTIDDIDWAKFKIERGELVTSPVVWEEFKRYKITDSGVSPRTIPGVPGGMYIATSDEHDERGDVITDRHLPDLRKAMHNKRMIKLAKIAEEMGPPISYGSDGITLVTWGSTAMPILDFIYSRGDGVGAVVFRDLYPLNKAASLEVMGKKSTLIDVELNYRGQLGEYLRKELGVEFKRSILKWWGEPLSVDELMELV
ncbi:2-oxoacid ferredoxin oxidoreductase, gamma-alpha subunit [Thermoproteus tenax Kra 1]|uniref:2-oxoacid oxidoreductase (ferredoxin) n=3 Tax=Thermoproteus tenax TaxID=2271 RepID=G4RKI9_THETK|nr:pyruvate-ferredoxin oxidoreductase and related 2-oxoacid-ferredoxin oxidoreductases gamma-alpha subunit [Thermoproteus tenax]CCC82084.1 2-oxoacid ferredoxin oxidoreductase, gamma-alpha subunit [Thermoproteus tenax Kra 1]